MATVRFKLESSRTFTDGVYAEPPLVTMDLLEALRDFPMVVSVQSAGAGYILVECEERFCSRTARAVREELCGLTNSMWVIGGRIS